MKVAITGASGHIGSAIIRELIKQGHEVVAMVHKTGKGLEGLPISTFKGSVLDKDSLRTLMNECDIVFHIAGIVDLGYYFDKMVYEVNVTGTENVFEVAKEVGVKRVVHFSSIHVFKQSPYDLPLDETRGFIDDKGIFYDQTKRKGHELALQLAKEGQDIVIVCPTGVIGPYDYLTSKLGKALIDLYKGNIPAVIKGGFDFVDVRDVAKGAISAMDNGKSGEAYILGGQFYTLKELAELIYQVNEKKKKFIELPIIFANIGLPFVKLYAFLTGSKPLYDKVYLDILQDGNKFVESKKAEKTLTYQKTDMKTTLIDTFEWLKQVGRL